MTKNAAVNWIESLDERFFYRNNNSIQQALDAYPGVQRRYYFQNGDVPCDVGASDQLDFNNSTTWCLQLAGRKNAKDALEAGQEQIQEGLDEWLASQEVREDKSSFMSFLGQKVDSMQKFLGI